jgi:ketosteroid isomerase-like protein
MKSALIESIILIAPLSINPKQKEPIMESFTEVEKEVRDQFNQLVSAINQMNAGEWSKFYSNDEFLSTIAGTDYYDTKDKWVDSITSYFNIRERQHIEPVEVRVTALAPNIALMTSEERSEIKLKDGDNIKSKHVFTMIWKKEKDVWKILHSHESWLDKQAN